MSCLKSLVISTSLLLPLAAGWMIAAPANTYQSCQRKTSSPLIGCPPETLYVSQSDSRAHFKSIQSAIASIPNDNTAYVILIAPGNYTEQLNVTRKAPLTLLGMSDRPHDGKSFANITSNTTHENDVKVYWNSANHNSLFTDNAFTSTLTVSPTLNASLTGSGPTGFNDSADTSFGNTNFRAYNIDFHNEFVPYSDGPALAISISRANAGFYSCGFYSWQDTIYIGKLGNTYFYDSIVAGQTDFLYGFGTLFIEKSTLSLRSCGGGITAWKGTNTTFVNKYGVYISNSQILAANETIAAVIKGKCALGRPWNAEHRSLFANTYFDPSILPAGYIPWAGAVNLNLGPNTTMAVYDVYGPGYNQTAEAASNVTKIFNARQAAPYLKPQEVFMTPTGHQPDFSWIDPLALL